MSIVIFQLQFLHLYRVKFDDLGEMHNFVEEYNIPKLTEDEIENLNSLVSI